MDPLTHLPSSHLLSPLNNSLNPKDFAIEYGTLRERGGLQALRLTLNPESQTLNPTLKP